ncbi:fumarylacetoacetate hydrolase family protein [Neorhizobium sp. DT-125]|uniref:fumarylacetoacetate hydrolase family protein n=1 Tax=Neorhizobium sp. DT-125 TaxID=3396163 RepID=UPI003F1C1CED
MGTHALNKCDHSPSNFPFKRGKVERFKLLSFEQGRPTDLPEKTHMHAPDIIALAHQLRSLRLEDRQVLTNQLTSLPSAIEDAVEVQRQLSKLEGADVSAWKVAKSPDGRPIVAPLHPYLDEPSDAAVPWRKGMKIEVEIAVRLGKDIPVRTDRAYERSDIEAAVSHVYLGAELVWSGIAEGGNVSFPAFLADRLGNAGYVRGPALPLAVLQPGSNIPLKLWLNKQVAFDNAAQHPTRDVLTWLCEYANDRSRPASSLRAGAIITTGSLCGAVDVHDRCQVSIQLGEYASLNFALS